MSRVVGVIGLGNMGGSVAARLVEQGHDVVGFDLDAGARERAVAAGVRAVQSQREAAGQADVTFTSLPNPAIVRAAWLDADGIVATAKPGAALVELSTIDPDTMRAIAQMALSAGLRVIDCPVSGGPREARRGELALIVGGSDEDIAYVEPVLADLGTMQRTGEVGTAKVVKIVNNMMSMGNVMVAAEAFAVGVAAGVDPHRLYEVLATSGGRSHHFTKRFPKALGGDFSAWFSIALGEKDLALGLSLARSVGVPAPAAATARDMYAVALAEGKGDQDIVALLEVYRRWAEGARR